MAEHLAAKEPDFDDDQVWGGSFFYLKNRDIFKSDLPNTIVKFILA